MWIEPALGYFSAMLPVPFEPNVVSERQSDTWRMNFQCTFLPILFVASLVCGACGSSQPKSPTAPTPTAPTAPTPAATATVSTIAVTGNSALVAIAQTSQMTANATLSTGGTQNVTTQATWDTMNSAIATVSATGLVTARSPGTVDIRATYQSVTGTLPVSVTQSLEVTLLRYDVEPTVPAIDLANIKAGILGAQRFLDLRLGGDITVNQKLGITVKVVSTGVGNQDRGGGGACCTALDGSGARLFFDVRHRDWINQFAQRWTVDTGKKKSAAHEYAHGWAWSLGALTINSQPLGDWMNEGIAEFVAYSSEANGGNLAMPDADAFELSSAIITGEATRCLSSLENSNQAGTGLWPGHIGYVAIKALVARSQYGILAIRRVNEDIGTGMTFDQAFQDAFGISKQDFYASFPAYVASLGGPRTCS